ncbi:MAG TPA: phosphatidylglycerophosphatase A [Pseudomonadales bacterium]|jgi:phosphatidylglycerophosphatase A
MSTISWRDARDPAVLISCGFGSGFLPGAPGTWGSLAATALWWPLLGGALWWVQAAGALLVLIAGTLLIGRVHRRHDVGDAPAIVIDEFAGMWLVLIGTGQDPLVVAAAFGLFRLFDIWKPWPVRAVEARVRGGLGVMLDDVIAGAMALFVLQVSIWAIGGGF